MFIIFGYVYIVYSYTIINFHSLKVKYLVRNPIYLKIGQWDQNKSVL